MSLENTPGTTPSPDKSPPLDGYVSDRPRSTVNVKPLWRRILAPMASLYLTVSLFVFGVLLVFYGTLAQRELSTWTAVDKYFRTPTLFVKVPNQLNCDFLIVFWEIDKSTRWGGHFYLPSGYLLGSLFVMNLIAAQIIRFKFSWRRSGIIIMHAGIVLMLVGELLAGLYSVEAQMSLRLGETSNVADIYRKYELVLIEAQKDGMETGIRIEDGLLKPGSKISSADLPVDIEVVEYWENTKLTGWGPRLPQDDTTFIMNWEGVEHYKLVKDKPAAGTDTESREDVPSVRIRILEKGTTKLISEMFLSTYIPFLERRSGSVIRDNSIQVGGQTYKVVLRNQRLYKPYQLTLNAFKHDKYMGSNVAKDFRSEVTMKDERYGTQRDAGIWMNHPFRYDGDTYYQHQFHPGDTGTVLMVVDNPSWILPYVSCAVVTLGMLIQFGLSLQRYLLRRAAGLTGNLPAQEGSQS